MTYQQIRKYEAGQNRVAAGTLVAIAAALGCTAAEIMDEVERPRRPAGEGAPTSSATLLRQIEALPADHYRSIEAIVAKLASSPAAREVAL